MPKKTDDPKTVFSSEDRTNHERKARQQNKDIMGIGSLREKAVEKRKCDPECNKKCLTGERMSFDK